MSKGKRLKSRKKNKTWKKDLNWTREFLNNLNIPPYNLKNFFRWVTCDGIISFKKDTKEFVINYLAPLTANSDSGNILEYTPKLLKALGWNQILADKVNSNGLVGQDGFGETHFEYNDSELNIPWEDCQKNHAIGMEQRGYESAGYDQTTPVVGIKDMKGSAPPKYTPELLIKIISEIMKDTA